ncbi:MAG: hypothetical protein NWE99_04465 [Candidatus Bathyarchaeota archaeon]|nr:hypothetical protein [Candidatus Bathyarchaeota archaeon]
MAYDDEEAVYRLVDAVKGYVNLIILGSLNVTTDTAKLTRVCDYLYQQGLYFIVYVGFGESGYYIPSGPDPQFFHEGLKRWGDKLLGAYVFDEAGGKEIDQSHESASAGHDSASPTPVNYTDAAEQFVCHTRYYLLNYSDYYGSPNVKLVTSDYALYWYDYLLGYDVVFGEFVGNQSRQLAVSLTRGAAKTMHKDWGTMITWKYMQPPFVEEPLQLLRDMLLAYRNGAKYIIVFNSPGNNTATTKYGILTEAHLTAIKLFWTYTRLCPAPQEFPAETAYVLPKDYGYGFRGPDDRIWGYFPPDALSPVVWNTSTILIREYGIRLDIVYETKIDDYPVNLPYERLIYWNGTIIEK